MFSITAYFNQSLTDISSPLDRTDLEHSPNREFHLSMSERQKSIESIDSFEEINDVWRLGAPLVIWTATLEAHWSRGHSWTPGELTPCLGFQKSKMLTTQTLSTWYGWKRLYNKSTLFFYIGVLWSCDVICLRSCMTHF